MEIFNKVINGINAVYSVRISRDDLNAIEENQIKELSKEVRIHGFRPGKVPAQMIRGMYGVAIASQAKKDSLERLLPFITKEEKLGKIVGFSNKVLKDDENGIECECSVVTAPEFELKDMADAKFEKPVYKATEDDAKKQLLEGMERFTNWKEDASHIEAKEGDKVIAHFDINDKKQANLVNDTLSHKDLDVILNDQYALRDIWNVFVGKKVGDICLVTVTLPGKSKKRNEVKVEYKAQIKQILVASKYELNDEFAKAIGFENIDEALKESQNRCQKKFDNVSHNILEREVLEYIGKKYDFAVPDSMINVELKEISRAIKVELTRLHKKHSSAIDENCRTVATDRVRIGFVVSKMAEIRGIKVSNAEFERYVRSVAMLSPGREKEVFEMYSRPESSAMVLGTLLESKVLNALIEDFEKNSQVIEKEVSEKDLYSLDEEMFDFVKNAEDMSKEEIEALEGNISAKESAETFKKAKAITQKHSEMEEKAKDAEAKKTSSKTKKAEDGEDAPKKKTASKKKTEE